MRKKERKKERDRKKERNEKIYTSDSNTYFIGMKERKKEAEKKGREDIKKLFSLFNAISTFMPEILINS